MKEPEKKVQMLICKSDFDEFYNLKVFMPI